MTNYSIAISSGTIIATASSAKEAWAKFCAGRYIFGRQTIVDHLGYVINEAELKSRCANETRLEDF